MSTAGPAFGGGGGGGANADSTEGSASVSPPGTSGSRTVSIEPIYGVMDSRPVHPDKSHQLPRFRPDTLLMSAHGRSACVARAGRLLDARPVARFDRDDRARDDESAGRRRSPSRPRDRAPPHRRAGDARDQDEGQPRRGRDQAPAEPDLRSAGRVRRRAEAAGESMKRLLLASLLLVGCRERDAPLDSGPTSSTPSVLQGFAPPPPTST